MLWQTIVRILQYLPAGPDKSTFIALEAAQQILKASKLT